MVNSSESFKFINFADDTTLITKLNINDSINDELAKFYNWLKANKLSLNVNKTKAIAFHMPQKIIQLPLLQIAGTNIEFVDNFNFIGLTINKHLKACAQRFRYALFAFIHTQTYFEYYTLTLRLASLVKKAVIYAYWTKELFDTCRENVSHMATLPSVARHVIHADNLRPRH